MIGIDETDALPASPSLAADVRAATCRTLQHLEFAIGKAMGPSLSVGPYWPLLLDIYLAEIEGKTIFQSCLSTDAAGSKPHRRAIRLAELGALIREPDRQDRRRTDLRLTPAAMSALDQTMDIVRALYHSPHNELREREDISSDLNSDEREWCNQSPYPQDGRNDETVDQGEMIAGGSISLPPDIWRSLGLQNGDKLLYELTGNEVRIRPAQSAPQRIQDRPRMFVPDQSLISEELFAARRAETDDD